jgi:hypothetical protein
MGFVTAAICFPTSGSHSGTTDALLDTRLQFRIAQKGADDLSKRLRLSLFRWIALRIVSSLGKSGRKAIDPPPKKNILR